MMANQDCYKVLGVRRQATAKQIKQAYRKLAREYHPDLNPGDKQAEDKFRQVQEAYDILGDSDKRDKYDRFGPAAFEQGAPGSRARTYHWSSSGGKGVEFDFGSGGFDDVLEGIFGEGVHRQRPRSRFRKLPGEDIQAELSISFQTAVLGGEVDVVLGDPEKSRLTITIPPGVTDGLRLRLAGKGRPSPAGGKPGDLLVLVRVEPDPDFTRKGADIYLEVPITVTEALLGADIDVPTLNGTITVNVPPGTSSGQKLRLRGKGGPKKSGENGDQYVLVKIVVPKQLDKESKRLAEELAQRNPMEPRKKDEG